MDKAALLSDFTSKVDQFARFQSFIDKAQAQASRFAPEVVEKVVLDNQKKSMGVVEQIIPLMGDLDQVIEQLEDERESVEDGAKDARFALDTLELRQMIGELDDDAFEAEAKDLKATIEDADQRVAAIDQELEGFRTVLERWDELGTKAGVLTPHEPDLEPEVEAELDSELEPESDPEPEVIYVEEAEPEADVLEVDLFEDEPAPAVVAMATSAARVDDMSVVFDEVDDEVVLEADEEEHESIDILAEDDALELQAAPADESREDRPRRAVLLYQEGTAEEQIYPFTGDHLSLGRGRDNDIQVKNDSKVSRYHCKLYRRGPNFYIEDNKSANGTLVNGELITERRLFGGEEIIIGETFFRFRIMD